MSVMTAEAGYAEVHGGCKSLAKTEIMSASDGTMIVSTVLKASGFGIQGGAFFIYETRVFGGKRDGFFARIDSSRDFDDVICRAIGEHVAAMREVVDAYWPRPADGETGDVRWA